MASIDARVVSGELFPPARLVITLTSDDVTNDLLNDSDVMAWHALATFSRTGNLCCVLIVGLENGLLVNRACVVTSLLEADVD